MIPKAPTSASRRKNPLSTLVVVARKNGKKVEALGATKEVTGLLNTVLDDGVSEDGSGGSSNLASRTVLPPKRFPMVPRPTQSGPA